MLLFPLTIVIKIPLFVAKNHQQRSNQKLGYQIKEKISINFLFLIFMKIFFLKNQVFITAKVTFKTIIKENNHFVCKSKLLKYY